MKRFSNGRCTLDYRRTDGAEATLDGLVDDLIVALRSALLAKQEHDENERLSRCPCCDGSWPCLEHA